MGSLPIASPPNTSLSFLSRQALIAFMLTVFDIREGIDLINLLILRCSALIALHAPKDSWINTIILIATVYGGPAIVITSLPDWWRNSRQETQCLWARVKRRKWEDLPPRCAGLIKYYDLHVGPLARSLALAECLINDSSISDSGRSSHVCCQTQAEAQRSYRICPKIEIHFYFQNHSSSRCAVLGKDHCLL